MRSPILVLFVVLLLLTALGANAARAEHEGKIQILLLGDSTTEGSVPRQHVPKGRIWKM